jgi:hypothetical protein
MTIHSDWSRILHDECANAFTANPPLPHQQWEVGIIDGHLQLMRLDPRMGTWECFVRNQFLKPIQSLFSVGCPRVVLCFDNYGAVPTYKTMTQNARTNKFEIRHFGPDDELPARVPEEPLTYLMNRNFKLKLIQMLCEQVPQRVGLQAGQELILDYKRVVRYAAGQHQRVPVPLSDMASMGESDVKFCRYVTKYGNALVHAIDGDYMAIALLYYANRGMDARNKICIYRQLSVLHSTSSTATGKRKRQLARRAAEEAEDGGGSSGGEEPGLVFFKPHKTKERQTPKKCWVNMQLVYRMIGEKMLRVGRRSSGSSEQDAVLGAVFLMLCAGTDFSRGTPLLGPKRMWDALPQIAESLMGAVGANRQIDGEAVLNRVIARLYAFHYSKHVGAGLLVLGGGGLEAVLKGLQRSKLSDGTKEKLPSVERMQVTMRNVQWVIQYWEMENGTVETPEDGEYGFARDGTTGELTFVDLMLGAC